MEKFAHLTKFQKKILTLMLIVVVFFLVVILATMEDEDDVFKPNKNSKHIIIKPGHRTRDTHKESKNSEKFPAPYPGPQNEKQKAVVQAFKHAWKAYKKYAWGHDELQADTKTFHEMFGLGLTLLDSLDTLYIMGLANDFNLARNWVASKLHVDIDKDVNVFETTIRALGGLLSAYHLSGDEVFLNKAKELGDRMFPVFNEDSKVPYSDVNLNTGKAYHPMWSKYSTTGEIATLQLEFTDLSRETEDPKYEKAVTDIIEHLIQLPKMDGLVPIYVDPKTGNFKPAATITLGSKGDSYYEYLLKFWIQTGKDNTKWQEAYEAAVEGAQKLLVKESKPNNFLFFGELYHGQSFIAKMDHLVCFLPGTFALGYLNGLDKSHLELAERFAETCFQMYAQMPTFLSPERVYFNINDDANEDFYVKIQDRHNLQRPEFIESLFYLYRTTKNKKYRDWGWRIFQAFEKYTKLPEGYTAINNVLNPGNVGYRNKMETFFLGETLKYFYLLFSDDDELLPLDKFVFNTEAHPLPIRNKS